MPSVFSFLTLLILAGNPGERIVIFHAGSLSAPLQAVEKAFAEHHPGVEVRMEAAGSVESARKITDLRREADILAVADYKVIEDLLFPRDASWSVIFARNHMVLSYSKGSKFAGEITPSNWYRVLLRTGVEYGRSDPDKDPCGYRTLMVWQLAERFYRAPGLYEDLVKGCPTGNIRPKETDLVALQEAGDLDYHFQYQSVAEQHGLRYLRLPPEIDLGSYHHRDFYAQARVEVTGKRPGETVTMTGEPILYAVTIPSNAPHPGPALRFLAVLLGPEGRRIMAKMGQEPVSPPIAVNPGAMPGEIRALTSSASPGGSKRTLAAPPLVGGRAALEVYRNGVYLTTLTFRDLSDLPPAVPADRDLNPAWTLAALLTSLGIPPDGVGEVIVMGAAGRPRSVPGARLVDTTSPLIMGYNRKMLIKLKAVSWKSRGPGAEDVKDVRRIDITIR